MEERTQRQELLAILRRGERSFEELRRELQLRVRELDDDLAHLERSLRHGPVRLTTTPPECLACGFSFRKRRRERFSTPGRCPLCRSERIAPARLGLAGGDETG